MFFVVVVDWSSLVVLAHFPSVVNWWECRSANESVGVDTCSEVEVVG